MREDDGNRSALRRLLRYLQLGLIHLGASVWPSAEVYAHLRSSAAHRRRGPAERVTAYEDLPEQERRLLIELEEQLKRETET